MRNIKFRGKTEDGRWIYGDLLHAWDSLMIQYEIELDDENTYNAEDVDGSTVGQFTGILDCKGREVYEGDLLMNVSNPNSDLLEVCFNESIGLMAMKIHSERYVTNFNSPFYQIYKIKYFKYEVVGNIHENKQYFEKSFAFESSSQT